MKVDEGPEGPAWTDDRTAEALEVASGETLVKERFELPAFSTLDRLAGRVRREVHEEIYARHWSRNRWTWSTKRLHYVDILHVSRKHPYLGARADELSLATLERRLAAIASLHKEEGYESPAGVAEGPLRKIWKGITREKTRQQDGASPLMVEDLKSIIEHLPRYSSSDDAPTGRLTLTALRNRALLLVGWTGALRRSELVALTTEDIQFIEGEGVNVYVRRSKSDQEAEGLVKGLPYGSGQETCPVTALR